MHIGLLQDFFYSSGILGTLALRGIVFPVVCNNEINPKNIDHSWDYLDCSLDLSLDSIRFGYTLNLDYVFVELELDTVII